MKKSMWKRSWMPAPMDSQGAVFGITETENDWEARPKSLPEEQGQGRRPSRQSGILTGVAIPKMSGSQVDSEQIWQSIYAQLGEQENQAGEPGPLQEEHDAATKGFHSSEPAECITVTTPDLPISPTQASSGQSSTSSLYDIEEKGKEGGDLPMLLSYTADDVASKKITGAIAVSAEMMIVDDFESSESSGEEHDDEETDEKSEAEEEEEEEEGKEEASTAKKDDVNASETSDNEYNETVMISITADPAELFNKESNSDEEDEAATAVMPNSEDANLQSLSESQVALPLHSEAKKKNTAVENEENDDICYEKNNEDVVEKKQMNEEEAERGTKVDSNSVSDTSIVAHVTHTATGGVTHEKSNTKAQFINEVKIAQEALGPEVHINESPLSKANDKTGISPSTTVSHTSATFPDIESSESASEDENINAEKKHTSLGYRTEEENKATIQEPLHIPVRELTILQTPNTIEEKQPAPPITLEMAKKPEAATSVMHLEAQNVIFMLASGSPSQQFNPTALSSTYVPPVQPVPTLQAASSQVQDAPYFPQIQNPTPPSMTTVPPPQPHKVLVPQCVPQTAHLEVGNLQANTANTAQIPPQPQVRASQTQSSGVNLQGGAFQVHSQVSQTQGALPTQENRTELQANDATLQEQVTPQAPLSHSQSSSPTKQSTPGGPNDPSQGANEPPDDQPPPVIEPQVPEVYMKAANNFNKEIKEPVKDTKEVTKKRKCMTLCCQSYKMNPEVYLPKKLPSLLTPRRQQAPRAMKSQHDKSVEMSFATSSKSCDLEAAINQKKYTKSFTTPNTNKINKVGVKATLEIIIYNLFYHSPYGKIFKDCLVYGGFGFTLAIFIISIVSLARDLNEEKCNIGEERPCTRKAASLVVAEFVFSLLGLIFTFIDMMIHTKERWFCKSCKELAEWRESEAFKHLTEYKVSADDSNQEHAACTCYRGRRKKIMDIFRTIMMNFIFYPAIVISILQAVVELELTGKLKAPKIVGLVFSALGVILTVYAPRIVMLCGSLRTLSDLFLSKNLGQKIKKFIKIMFPIIFVLYSIGIMFTQIAMIIVIGISFKKEVAEACKSDCKSKIKWHNLDYKISSGLVYIMIIGGLLPIISTFMFFIVHKFWTYKLPLDVILNIITTMLKAKGSSGELLQDLKEYLLREDVAQDLKNFNSIRFIDKFFYPFSSPIIVILCISYVSLLAPFPACSEPIGGVIVILIAGIVNIYAVTIVLFWVSIIIIILVIIATIVVLFCCCAVCTVCTICFCCSSDSNNRKNNYY